MAEFTNRLALASSPYLRQHAHNPVDWYPWGADAFERARREDKPIFLSIGYSTCHWCHVMERESFENPEIARLLNEHFVAVKVDREERPDVDAVYMRAVQTMSGGAGGWPLSAFLTPEKKPFFGGTYFPPEDRFGRAGFKSVLARIAELWESDRQRLEDGSEQVAEALRAQAQATGGKELGPATLARCVEQYVRAFDRQHGGFGLAPKFPRSFSLTFLLRQAGRSDGTDVRELVTSTLDALARGGIHDHLGGGFHRYSTDREWLLPHFEKMLYDQAFLARAFLDGFVVTGRPEFADAARGIFTYVLRDLADPAGGFRSAEDADSEGVEGKFYVWTRDELVEVLGPDDGALVADVYGATAEGNFLEEATRRRTGENVLHLPHAVRDVAKLRGEDPEQLATRLAALRARLLEHRAGRIRPHLDDKVLTDWNGMWISALARGGVVLDEPVYLDAARRAADFLLTRLRTPDGLLHRYRDGDAGIDAFLDDYAFLGQGLLDLHQATQEARWLAASRDLARELLVRFRDDDGGGLHFTAHGAEALVARPKDLYDGATPSGNSEAALLLVRLGRVLQDDDLEAAGRALLDAWSGTIDAHPMSHPRALTALDELVGPAHEIVIAGSPDDKSTRALLREVRSRYLPRAVLVVHDPDRPDPALRALVPYLAGMSTVDGRPAAYVCTGHSCRAPVTSAEELARLLDELTTR